MKHYIKVDEWNIIEEGFDPHLNKVSESLFSIGNGRMGQRANFEEAYSGESLPGNYVAGVYYPDKTRVGWWKNGYPEYFAKVLNAANWIGIDIRINDEVLDLHNCTVRNFRRVLNMKAGYLERSFTATLPSGKQLQVHTQRFCSIVDDEAGAIRYAITPINFDGQLTITPFIDGDVKNQDANYDEKFWEEVQREAMEGAAYLTMRTKKTGFEVCTGMRFQVYRDGLPSESPMLPVEAEKYVASRVVLSARSGEEIMILKYAANLSSENHAKDALKSACHQVVEQAFIKGFDQMLQEQAAAWAHKWEESDIVISGDAAAQQGIRFNIFQLHQTYTGEDARLNIGPKGFTGEKYGGAAYWDTEAYCIPFYLATADPQVARNLLLYRYRHLPKAIENAAKLGFTHGAALYPMVTMNGEECHNEWEITFEEIHRNGAIAFAIFNYIRYTGDALYLADHGLEVLIAVARFWAQRVNWSQDRERYVMLGVTGPNEYENNVNNNWYTNTMAAWCLEYALEALEQVQRQAPDKYMEVIMRTYFREQDEMAKWRHIISHMYYPADETLGVFLQQDGYLDKEQVLARDLDPAQRPLNQHWSWDRILRSCFIKQADVLQGLYFLEDRFDEETLRRNFDFYEPRTVHESSLSPCVHAILAAKLGDEQRAYEFYLRTSRLDLDDYNNDTEDGLHITSMAGTWMSVVEGFAGMRVRNGRLSFAPFLPAKWQSFAFKIRFRGALLKISVDKRGVQLVNRSDREINVTLYNGEFTLKGQSQVFVSSEGIKA
ncbi:glycoside hydrolase family 65 protein [Chitinophaga agrisoli]|uniref:Glycoside hydrolase family 65 protein n=1 Tax=Chitinophaga agrisoli TaxID=2607653 RepID=A0A5B2VLQ8_9BACT|nr:glycoside hydrolase family 65 protein [Chitinophaga agrisoli]KAA2240011.1 glycoside hydrolase family 65 protein [Chitinophaga agrisoli]